MKENNPLLSISKLREAQRNANPLIPISKLPDSLRDGRCVMVYSDGVHFCCRWMKNGWYLGEDLIANPTHFSYPRYSLEQGGSGI